MGATGQPRHKTGSSKTVTPQVAGKAKPVPFNPNLSLGNDPRKRVPAKPSDKYPAKTITAPSPR